MANRMNSFDIKFGDFETLNSQLEEIGSAIEDTLDSIAHVFDKAVDGSNPNLFHILERQLKRGAVDPMGDAVDVYAIGWQLGRAIPTALRGASSWCCLAEWNVMKALIEQVGEGGSLTTTPLASTSFADEFYPAEIARREEEQRQKDEQDKADAAYESALALALAACPEAAAEYQEALDDAAFEAALAEIEKHDPELAAKLRKEYEERKKAREEAKKAAEEAEKLAGELGEGLDGDSGWGGGGGSGDLGGGLGDLGGSDWGGSGIDTDWGSSDFASDLLDDNIDTGELADAATGLDGITDAGMTDAVAGGVDAVADAAADEAAGGLWAKYGPQLTEMAQRYGVQAGLVLGGAAAAYATREQTTEAVAHVAEFVSTKCKPAVNDVMDQVRGAAKQTHVRLDNAKSGVKAAARGERVGDLIG